MTISVKAANTGAYVSNVDLSSLTASDVVLLKETLGEHGVLFFRNQSLSPEQHIAFAENFGGININLRYRHWVLYWLPGRCLKQVATHSFPVCLKLMMRCRLRLKNALTD